MDIPLSRAEEIIKSGKLVFSPQLGTFTVMGFSDVPRVVRLYPTEYCSCGVKTTCYHKIAVKKSIGLAIETRRKINLTELKRKRKSKGEGKSGRKRPRANDYDVIPADPGKQSEEPEPEPEGDQPEGDEHISITDVTLEPGNEGQIASCHRLDGPVWKKIGDMQLRQEEKEILSHRGDWLNDRIMDAAQILLRRQFPYISGLDTVLKAQNLSYDCHPNNPFIQIVNRTAMKGEGSHWLMFSTLDCKPRKEVKIYRLGLGWQRGGRLNSELSVGVFVSLERTHFLKLQGSFKTTHLVWRTCFQEKKNSWFFASGVVYISK